MSWETLSIIITQILCSVFIVFSLFKLINKSKINIKDSSLALKVEVSDLLNKNNELSELVLILYSELDTKNNITKKQDSEMMALTRKIKKSCDTIQSLEKELSESQRYLRNCWDKIKSYERDFGIGVNTTKLQPALNKSSEYDICKACDKDVKYCICGR